MRTFESISICNTGNAEHKGDELIELPLHICNCQLLTDLESLLKLLPKIKFIRPNQYVINDIQKNLYEK